MQTYLEIGEFCKLVHLSEDVVNGMMANGSLNFKEENGKVYIEANQGTFSVVPKGSGDDMPISSISLAGESFVEKTIGTILNLHEKVLDAKDETLETLKNENKFLKDVLYSMQEIYDEDRKTIDILNEQLGRAQEEVEFMKRKYKLMWNKAVDNFTQGKISGDFGDDEASESVENSALNSGSVAGAGNSSVNSGAKVDGANSSVNLAENSSVKADENAENSASSVENSTQSAENSAVSKETSQTNAENSATNANEVAQSSTNSATNAENSAQNASAEALNSANSAPNEAKQ